MSRLRNIPGSRERIAASAFVIRDPEQQKGRWRKLFSREAPLLVEIGMGKGKFLMEMAAAHPENNYIGIEMYSAVLLKAVQKAEACFLGGKRVSDAGEMIAGEGAACENDELRDDQMIRGNFIFVRFDATDIETIFAPGEVDTIYLNFSDPWPKDRHAHRRLTSDRFLTRYRKILSPDGRLEFKTDNDALFTYSLEMLNDCGWKVTAATRDLYGERELINPVEAASDITGAQPPDLFAGNIASEYEEKFSGRGKPICKLVARPPTLPPDFPSN